MKQSGYLKRQNAIMDELVNSGVRVGRQMCMDEVQVCLHLKHGWGYDRIKALFDEVQEYHEDCKIAMDPRNPEADIAQEHMDRVLRDIVKDHRAFIPFKERYPEIKQVKYR